ncbi:zinc finger protein 106 [Melanotaenia boesemani]|uniref:zinc finger protein 106 n=1 Tax=Melanotaenia boesemani TaxID=1250792 RepID=UPI001C04E3F3|nr:zinc finger protein 106 [Melanotaenia boesemani]
MMRERMCILCETVYVSRQEMDEHIRSMLHHRELEKLKGRDCGHECRVCKVKVVSLTDYASHISSPTHKQNVEAADKPDDRNNHDEDYFDQTLVDLVEKRKEHIRKEKEAAAAKLAKEEAEQRKKEDFQERLKEVKERYRLEHVWQPPLQRFSGPNHQYTWYKGNQFNVSTGDARPWHHYRQGKSATWHAQEPPNLQKWASEEFSNKTKDSHWEQSNRTWGHGNKQWRLPWLSSGGSSNGLYGQNNISKYAPRARPQSFVGFPTPPSFFSQAVSQLQSKENDKGSQQDAGHQHGDAASESDHNSSKNSKAFGSNPKLDKSCRWSPYPVTSGVHSDAHTSPSEKYHKVPKPLKQEKAPEVNRQSQPEQRQKQMMPNRQNEDESGRHRTKPTPTDRSWSSSQRDGHQNSSSGSFSQRVNKPQIHADQKSSSAPGVGSGALLSKASGQALSQPKPPGNLSGLKIQPVGLLQLRQERHLPESFKTARHNVLEKRGSLDSSSNNSGKMTWHIMEEQQTDQGQNQIGVNIEKSQKSQNAAKPVLTHAVKPEKPSSDSSQFLQSLQVSTSNNQSLQVSTSVMESSAPALRDDEESKKKVKKQTCPADEAMLVAEAGQSSESDASKSGETQTCSESNTSSFSKLDLPPALKRDLTKHISSKSKTGGHEPNLNIARRVRNLSESRRVDTEKDSGLKPTVRQLISSSGSRRNVNWEQVYQEVRKKQDKGKGMPRFGIEMVPCDQEYQSQEEENLAFLEGFNWESLMDISAQDNSRKRSLSESSLAPGSAPSLFSSLSSEEKTQSKSLSSEQQSSAGSPSCMSAERKQDYQCSTETKLQRQPDKLTSATVKVLQRSDSVLGDSSSATEQCDGQGTGKRRRAAGETPSKEASCLEHNSKRMKVKSKRERLHIDQLLAVSLREEELSRSLQNVDTSLIQARAALEAAYMEVQRLMVVKQQVTVEMSTLRNKRIELLKGMQGTVEEAPLVKLKEEKIDSFVTDLHMPSSVTCPSVLDTAVCSPNHAAECASPPSSSLPSMPVFVKEEPQSPVHISSELDAVDSITHCPHRTTPELPVAHATTSPDPTLNHWSSPERKFEPFQTNCEKLADYQGESPGLLETTEKAVQASSNCKNPLSDSKTLDSLKLSPSRRSSEVGSVVDWAENQSTQSSSVLNMPASPSGGGGRRVRKLKKRKALKKSQGTEQPETSETEMDEEASRPRWLRQRRRPSGGSQVSTSSLPADDREGSMNTEDIKKAESPKNMVELPQAPPADDMGNLDTEESMEVTAACQQSQMDAPVPALVPDSLKPEPQSLACNEVSSTSDMDLCKSSESDLPFAITLLKTSSDVSSDHGEDEMPTEGMFDGHQEAVNAMQIHNGLLYTCSGDRTIKAFDLVSHRCVGVFEGHTSKVTCLLVSAAPCLHHRLYSGSNDQTIRCYSLKTWEFERQFSLSDRVFCLHSRWKTLYVGLGNGTVVTFNLKTNKQMDVFECHGPRAVSCLASLQEGAQKMLLVGSYDSTISVREAKSGVLLRTLQGHTKTVLCMKVVNDLVFSGSSDHSVYAHNIHTGELVQAFKGHTHAVTVVAILGKMMVTACLDKLVRVYDIQTQDQMQVYGGHMDMVLCMTIHKNMIYTGCYDGSVQAVKLNLIQNYRCWWHGCSLVFGMTAHLLQHLTNDHANASFQKCRWKKCEEFLCARSSSKKKMQLHMQKHAEEETEAEP